MPHSKPNHGLYSSKSRVPLGYDLFNPTADLEKKKVVFNCTIAPFYEPKDTNSSAKGKQVVTKTHLPLFSKYSWTDDKVGPDVYDDGKRTGEVLRKNGFGVSGPLNRDDLSSTKEVDRFRHHLKLEERMSSPRQAGTESPEGDDRSKGSLRLDSGTLASPSKGLSTKLPAFTTQFDRQRHVAEFSTRKFPPEAKYVREYGATLSMSHNIGEGCEDASRLLSPARGIKKPDTHSAFAHPTCSMLSPTAVQ